jgi:hypothetical protein
MSTHTDTLRQVRRNTATVRGRALLPSDAPAKPSSMTQSFFARGEEQEATGYEGLAPDDPLLVPREVEFDSFDKIPRRRGSWFAIAVSALVLVAIGVVTWQSFRYLAKPGSSVAAASRAMVQAPATESQPVTAPADQQEPMSIAPPAQATPVTEPPAATEPAPVKEPPTPTQPQAEPPPPAQPAPVAQPAPAVKPAPVRHQPAKQATTDEPARGRHGPLRGYVWSPDKHTLVPGEPAVEDSLPRKDPGIRSLDGAPGEEPEPQVAPTSPAPFHPSPSSTESAPIID